MNSYAITKPTYRLQIFFMFMMFMWVARVTPLTSFKFGENPYLMPIYIIILLYYYLNYCKKSFKPLLIFLSIFGVWFSLVCIKYHAVQGFYFLPIYNIIVAHVAFNIYTKDEFIKLYEDILVKLCVLSLIVWFGANLFPSVVPKFMHSIAVIENNGTTETNSFIIGLGSQITIGLRRNIGFTWEAGRFACFIILGMFCNLIRNRFKIFPIKSNKNLYVLIFTLLTTLSTTGYSVIVVIIFMYILNSRQMSKWVITILVIVLLPSIWGLPFMSEKIESISDIDVAISAINYYEDQGATAIVPQRFPGLYFNLQNLLHDPLLGYCQNENSYIQKDFFKGFPVWTSDGVIQILSKYGIFVGLFFYYWLFKSSRQLSRVWGYRGILVFALLFIFISISYDFWENCLFMYLYLYSFYYKYGYNSY